MSLRIRALSKTLSSASLFLSLSSPLTVMAGGYDAPLIPMIIEDRGHVYLGLQLGMGLVDGQYRARASTENISTGLNFNGLGSDYVYQRWHTAFGGSSVLAGAVLGVDTVFIHDIYAALELNTTYDSYKRSMLAFRGPIVDDPDSESKFRIRVKNNFLYGLTAKLGKDMGGYIPYLVGGVEGGSWRTTVCDGSDPILALFFPALNNLSELNSPSVDRFSKTRYAPTAGLGVRFKIDSNWQGDLQYRYSWFGYVNHREEADFRGFREVPVFAPSSVVAEIKHRINPNQGKALFSLNYYFDA